MALIQVLHQDQVNSVKEENANFMPAEQVEEQIADSVEAIEEENVEVLGAEVNPHVTCSNATTTASCYRNSDGNHALWMLLDLDIVLKKASSSTNFSRGELLDKKDFSKVSKPLRFVSWIREAQEK